MSTDLTAWLTWVDTCYDCDKPYEQCGDVSMDNETWRKISPTGDEGGLLCANCTMARLGKEGIASLAVMLFPPLDKDVR